MICVDCGVDAEGLIGGSCASCFAKNEQLMDVAEVVHVELCSHCGARHVGAHWHDVPDEEPELYVLQDAVRDQVGVHKEVEGVMLDVALEEKDNKTFAMDIELNGRVGEVRVQAKASGLLRRTRGVCNRCSRINGGYFAAILQLRATERDMSAPELEIAHNVIASELDRQLASGNRFAFLAKSEPMHGGFDYYVGDIDAGRNAARRLKARLGGTVAESAKLVGRKEGEDVYRVTFLIRLHQYSSGDVLVRDQVPHVVMQALPKSIATLDLEKQLRGRIPLDGNRRIGGLEVREEAVVISRGDDGVMILDPQNQKTVTVLVPDGEDIEDTVSVVRVDERLYWVPAQSTNNP